MRQCARISSDNLQLSIQREGAAMCIMVKMVSMFKMAIMVVMVIMVAKVIMDSWSPSLDDLGVQGHNG